MMIPRGTNTTGSTKTPRCLCICIAALLLYSRRIILTTDVTVTAETRITTPLVSASSSSSSPITSPTNVLRKLVLGVDGGTESIRACCFDAVTGRVVGRSCAAPYNTYHPYPGYAEQDPKDWWESCRIAIRHAIQSVNEELSQQPLLSSEHNKHDGIDTTTTAAVSTMSSSYEICAMAMDTTCCSVVACDTNMKPLRNCILWMDQRAVHQTQQILQHCRGDVALNINNHGAGPISAEWMIPKAMWIQQNEPQVWQQAHTICEYQDYINYQLTGVLCASACNAITRWHWDGTTCCDDPSTERNEFPGRPMSLYQKLGISDLAHKLPSKCIPMGMKIGTVTKDAADFLGLPNQYDIPVIQGGPDAFVGMIGLGCIESGQLCLITGSSHLHCIVTSQPNTASGIWGTYRNAPLPTLNFAEGGQSSTGSILRWAKRLFGGIDDDVSSDVTYKILDAEAEDIPPGADGLVALETFQGSRTPTTDPLARGALVGLTLSHTRGHIWRALMESVCYGTRACMEGLAAAGHTCEEIILAGGVTRSTIWLQMHADITGKIVTVCENSDAPLLGCAILASAGIGIHDTVPDAVRAMVRTLKQVHPNQEATNIYSALYQAAYKKMLPTIQPIVHSLHSLRGGGEPDVPDDTIHPQSHDRQQQSKNDIAIAPSLLACDWANMEREVHRCCSVGVPRIHIDVFDGVYLNSPQAFTFGPQMVRAIRDSVISYSNKMNGMTQGTIMDLHLCVDRPERFVETMADVTAGLDSCFIFQWEAMSSNITKVKALIDQVVDSTDMTCGISINPSTNIEDMYPILKWAARHNKIAVIDILAVEPGFGGQTFQSDVTIHKVQALHQFRSDNNSTFQIMIDGGINNVTCIDVVRNGADILVAGTFLFHQHPTDLNYGISAIRKAIDTLS